MDADQDRRRLLAALPGILRQLAGSGVWELEVSAGQASLYVRQRPGPPLAEDVESTEVGAGAEGLIAVAAPLAGIFYDAPSPDQPPYVTKGEAVEAGQVVALVEAMKVFNEIHVEVGGVIEDILVAGGQAVQAGQTLMTLRPDPPAPYGDSPAPLSPTE